MADITNITVPISASTLDVAVQQAQAALMQGAQMLELRVDYLQGLTPRMVTDLINCIRNLPFDQVPIIVTCRDHKEGGVQAYPFALRLETLIQARQSGADYIDIEFRNLARAEKSATFCKAFKNQYEHLIVSAHSFSGPFTDLRHTYHDIKTTVPKSIPKLVYTANHINDCFTAFDLLQQTEGRRTVFCMGPAGLISRILAVKLNSFCTFASLDDESGTAPGQLTMGHMKMDYHSDIIDEHTDLYGVIADPVGHSLSPAIHNACFRDLGMNRAYLPLWIQGDMEALSTFLEQVRARPWLGFRGFSVTLPHKQNVITYVKDRDGTVEPLTETIGAANTLIMDPLHSDPQVRIKAYNTDYSGALQAVTSTLGIKVGHLQDWPVAVVGAGGVARALVAGLTDTGCKVTIYNRTKSKAQALAGQFHCRYEGLDKISHLDARLVINCTSIGMFPDVDCTPIPKHLLHRDMVVFDTVYNPAQTKLLELAQKQGAKCIDGISMFVYQAQEQFLLFTGRQADATLMRKVICDKLNMMNDPSINSGQVNDK